MFMIIFRTKLSGQRNLRACARQTLCPCYGVPCAVCSATRGADADARFHALRADPGALALIDSRLRNLPAPQLPETLPTAL